MGQEGVRRRILLLHTQLTFSPLFSLHCPPTPVSHPTLSQTQSPTESPHLIRLPLERWNLMTQLSHPPHTLKQWTLSHPLQMHRQHPGPVVRPGLPLEHHHPVPQPPCRCTSVHLRPRSWVNTSTFFVTGRHRKITPKSCQIPESGGSLARGTCVKKDPQVCNCAVCCIHCAYEGVQGFDG